MRTTFRSVAEAVLLTQGTTQCGNREQQEAARILVEGNFSTFDEYLRACPGHISIETAGTMYSTWQQQA